MFVWIQKNWQPISIIGTTVAFAGALIGWHFVSQIPEARIDLFGIFVMSCVITALTITSYLFMEDRWQKVSLLDRPLPILASFVFPMFAGTWSILWDIPDYLSKQECVARSTAGQSHLWRNGHCYTPEKWRLELCEKHPTYCD
jgi:hypothetical protein